MLFLIVAAAAAELLLLVKMMGVEHKHVLTSTVGIYAMSKGTVPRLSVIDYEKALKVRYPHRDYTSGWPVVDFS